MRKIPLLLILMLILSPLPSTGGVSSKAVSTSDRARGLLVALDRLANYTETLGCRSEGAYSLRERAWNLYEAGEYNESIKKALTAMRLYRSALLACKREMNETSENNWVAVARVEIAITTNVLEYARKLMESGNLTEGQIKLLKAEYNQTLLAYRAVELSLERNDTRDISHKVAFLRASRRRLEATMKLIILNSIKVNARRLGIIQLHRINRIIGSGANSTEILLLRAKLEEAIKAGRDDEILEILRMIPKVVGKRTKKGKMKDITHTPPGHPSFPESPTEGSPAHQGRKESKDKR